MNSEQPPIDPAIEALLVDMAGDPASSLLKVLAAQTRASLFDPRPNVEGTGALLTKAERHVLRAHREEVATLLRRASLLDVYEDPATKRFLHTDVTAERELDLPTRAKWNAAATEAIRNTPDNADSHNGLELLAKCVHPKGARPSATALALASLRLVPSAEARICLALDLWRRNKLESAVQVLCLVIAHSPSDLLASIAWENLGGVYFGMGHYARARESYANATTTHAERCEPTMCWFLLSLGLDRNKEALNAAARMCDVVGEDHRSVGWFKSTQPAAWSAKAWPPNAQAKRNLRQIEKKLGPAAKEVAHVLA